MALTRFLIETLLEANGKKKSEVRRITNKAIFRYVVLVAAVLISIQLYLTFFKSF